MQSAGYRTAFFGKYLNEYDLLEPAGYVPPGWSEWGVFLDKNIVVDDNIGSSTYYENYSVSENGRIVEYTGENTLFGADLITQKSVDFISANRDTPFFMIAGYYNPHSPYMWADRHNEQFRFNSALEAPQPYRPPNFLEEDMSDKPVYLQELSSIAAETVDISYKQILRSLLSVDDGVASILHALEKTGLSHNTIIIFMTDNSIALGNHHLGLSKDCPYEECIRTPFIVHAPDLFPARTDPRIVANIDLAPTFADMAGSVAPSTVDGMSLLPLLKDTNTQGRDAILIEHWPTEDGIGSRIPEFDAVRTSEWKYIEYSTGERELYDLKNDPYELENLASDAQYEGLMAELKIKLDALKAQ
jgi:arylsulfatase A-like enzyme